MGQAAQVSAYVHAFGLVLAVALLSCSFCATAAHSSPAGDGQLPEESSSAVTNPLNPCGHFDTWDTIDAGNEHQPCYGAEGEVLFCW